MIREQGMKKVELLAPAGSYESFLGAIHAGADAVYLGGQKFGARAYADNFTTEEVCRAIRYAHIYGKKVYLTLNTLVKNREFDEIYNYVLPFYQEGLDGIIIQDFGVFSAIGEWFPGIERHISTQMTVTGVRGAVWLKQLQADRIVPARELTLEEIRKIKEETDIELETFVHGAVCYCYSGQCLFSSLLGGRSGNRGRCAQPCRLPYRMEQDVKEQYPLSLKDMCTIAILPKLIEAGIDSFKIEGRMKSPEYAAGVTAIYRKYIDLYYTAPDIPYQVDETDMEKLRSLYIRSEISEGYYFRHNGKEMITLDSPAYAGRDDVLAEQIRKDYVEADMRLPVQAAARLVEGEPAELTLVCKNTSEVQMLEKSWDKVSVTVHGECVQPALKQPLSRDAVSRQLNKFGNTSFMLTDLEVKLGENVFLPVKALNELRRRACEQLEQELAGCYGLAHRQMNDAEAAPDRRVKEAVNEKDIYKRQVREIPDDLHVCVLSREQAMAAAGAGVSRIYLASELSSDRRWLEKLTECCGEKTELYLALPHVMRYSDKVFCREIEALFEKDIFSGLLARNVEELGWLDAAEDVRKGRKVVTDAGLYIWNAKAYDFLAAAGHEHYLPYELNLYEIRELIKETGNTDFAMTIYGRLPMMVSANCIAKTEGACRKQAGENGAFRYLTDRYQKKMPVYVNCSHCYNVIFNSLPLSLHQNITTIKKEGIHTFRLDFTTENGNDVDRIIRYFKGILRGEVMPPPYEEYTKGHFKRGVE